MLGIIQDLHVTILAVMGMSAISLATCKTCPTMFSATLGLQAMA